MAKKMLDRLVVQMDSDLKKRLLDRSKVTGVNVSEFVRRVLVQALKEKL